MQKVFVTGLIGEHKLNDQATWLYLCLLTLASASCNPIKQVI